MMAGRGKKNRGKDFLSEPRLKEGQVRRLICQLGQSHSLSGRTVVIESEHPKGERTRSRVIAFPLIKGKTTLFWLDVHWGMLQIS